ncbi:uncharacterized protein isoform X1 [Danio rerio]|uniref:Si:ch211-241e1.5 n=6 Tax=Danio rerio TaxID=7955 RepID=A8DZG6_DANRE|nr:uncharacterized protein LOC567583 [Danio rerio]|eukprot:NP_001119897.1 uncharacterized protein LOC567583 [Danio rerio]
MELLKSASHKPTNMECVKEECEDVHIPDPCTVKDEETEEQIDCTPVKEETQDVKDEEEDEEQLIDPESTQTSLSCTETHNKRFKRRRLQTKPGFKCSQCGKSFSREGHLESHMRIHTGETPFTCKQCGKRFNQKGNLYSHMKIHSGESPFRCQQCGKSFNQKGNLKLHMRIHTGECPFTCKHCDKSFSLKGNLMNHMKTHSGERSFACRRCGKSFTQNKTLKSHMKVHEGDQCGVCSRHRSSCSDAKCSNRHLRTKHEEKQTVECSEMGISDDQRLTSDDREKPFQCQQCPRSFRLKRFLQLHLRIHTGEKPFVCRHCGETYTHQGNFKVHVRMHTEERPFICPHCGKHFHHQGNLRSHMRLHTREKPYPCPLCGESFVYSTHLKTHLEFHSERGKSHMLKREYVNEPSSQSEDSRFICDCCGRNFLSRYHLEVHQICRGDDRPHVCCFCSMSFKWIGNLKAHMRWHGSVKAAAGVIRRPLIHSDAKTDEESGKLKRGTCETSTEAERREKNGEKLYYCSTCGMSFSTCIYLLAHKKKHCPK